jgi:hypothetical protein
MPKRGLSPKNWRIIYEFVVHIHGEICADCGVDAAAITQRSGKPKERLTLDHINGDITDYSPENLQPLCRSCNTRKGNRQRRERAELSDVDGSTSTHNDGPPDTGGPGDNLTPQEGVYEREKKKNAPRASTKSESVLARRDRVIGEGPDAPLKANRLYINKFEIWLPGFIDEVNQKDGTDPTKEDVLNSGSFDIAASQQVLARYLAGRTSTRGDYREYLDADGMKRIGRK